MVQIGKFLCLSDREFPEFFKTHPTLICRSIFNASRSLQTNRTCYLIALVLLYSVLNDLTDGICRLSSMHMSGHPVYDELWWWHIPGHLGYDLWWQYRFITPQQPKHSEDMGRVLLLTDWVTHNHTEESSTVWMGGEATHIKSYTQTQFSFIA